MPEFQVLGPVQVLEDGEPINIGGPKPRTLVALLVARAGESISSDFLIDALWGEDVPEAAANTLQSYVSRLRRAVGPTTIVSTGSGYRLEVADDAIDAHRFEALVAEAQPLLESDAAQASLLLDEALGLWKGRAFERTDAAEVLRPEITRLEELRLGAFEARFEAELTLGRHGAAVGEIEALLVEHPWRERLWAQVMTALYRSGRQGEALRAYQRAHRILGEELGIEPSAELRRLEEQILLQDPDLGAWSTSDAATRNPYKGLQPFREADATDFHGRRSLTASLLETLGRDARFLAIIGPSGSGKSSAVRAGLIPALRSGALPGSDSWVIAQMLPGAHPFAELEAALLHAAPVAPVSLTEQFADSELGFLKAALRVLPEDTVLVLLIDQFEEVFLLVPDESEQRRFLANLMTAVADPRGRIRVVATMRADFYGRVLSYPEFGAVFTSNLVNVMPMSAEELRSALVEPAAAVGVEVEPALVTDLVADVVSQTGALPLFQYTLTELFNQQSGGELTRDLYGRIGGLNGALIDKAEELYEALADEQRPLAGQLFLRLVTVTDHADDTRRRVSAEELAGLGSGSRAEMTQVIDHFANQRLLTFDRDLLTGAPTVEVAHEALLREWPRLRDWIADHRDDLRTHTGFTAATSEWLDAGQSRDYLLVGERLTHYEDWAASTSLQLTETERGFLDASITARDEATAAEQERAAAEERLRRRARTRLWAAAAAVVALIAVGGVILWQTLDPGGPKIALIQAGDTATERFGEITRSGWEQAVQELEFRGLTLVSLTDAEADLRRLGEEGYDVVISFDGALRDLDTHAENVAGDYPETLWVALDHQGEGHEGSGQFLAVSFDTREGSFLAGAAAAFISQTGIVGFVGATQDYPDAPDIEAFRAGFEAGARHVDPDIEVLAAYIAGPDMDGFGRSFERPDLGREIATRLYQRDADVIFHAAGNSGTIGLPQAAVAQSAALGRKQWVIGLGSDESLEAENAVVQEHILTSVVNRYDKAVHDIVAAAVAGDLQPGVVELGLAEQGVDYSSTHWLIDYIDELEIIKASIAAGEVSVPHQPTGPLLPSMAFFEHDPIPADAELLERFYTLAEAGDIEGAMALTAVDQPGDPFLKEEGHSLEFAHAVGVVTLDIDCAPTRVGARCVMEREDELTRRAGFAFTHTVEAAIQDGVILGIVSGAFDEQRNQLIDEYFWWYFDHHLDEVISACPIDNLGRRCGEFHLKYIDDFLASRG